MRNFTQKLTKGTLSLILATFALILPLTRIRNLLLGDLLLNLAGYTRTASSYNGMFVTLLCSLLIFTASVILAVNSKEDLKSLKGAKIVVWTIAITAIILAKIFQ